MARETKLGLIIGLGVILLIGILVSDHLSKAQQSTLLTAPDTTTAGYETPHTSEQRRISTPPLQQPLPTQQHQPQPQPRPQSRPTVNPRNLNTLSSTVEQRSTERRVTTTNVGNAAGNTRRYTVIDPQDNETHARPSRVDPNRVTADGDKVHYVKEGETLGSIADQYYGDTRYWRMIAEANQDVIPDPNLVRPGVRLVIPSRGETTTIARTPETAIPAPDASPRYETYTVTDNDNLSRIADKTMGDSNAWPKIFEANRDQLDDPDQLRPGMKLKIPLR